MSPLSALLLTAVALAVGPAFDPALRGSPRAASFATGATQVIVVGLVLVHVLPFGLGTAGWLAGLALLGGLALGVLAHRFEGGTRWAPRLVFVGLLIHSAIDGAAIAAPGQDADHLLWWAVILHSMPVGAASWRVAYVQGGWRTAAGVIVASIAATAAGWWWADRVLAGLSGTALGVAQCLIAGALLHVVEHLGADTPRRANGAGALVGAVGVIALAVAHPVPALHPGELDAIRAIGSLFLEAAPALLLGYLAAGALHAFAPEALPRWLRGSTDLMSAARGALVGLPVPVCSCGALPVYRGLLARGAPPAAALAFLVAGPEVGVGTLLVSVPLLGVELTLYRLIAAFVVALGVAFYVAPHVRPMARAVTTNVTRPAPWRTRLQVGLRFGLEETVEHTAPWVLAGLILAGLIEPALSGSVLTAIPGTVGVLVAALAGIPLYVCASGATPLVAVLMHKGLSAGAAVAFLLTGPATNITTFGVLHRLHGRGVAIRFGVGVLVLAVAAGLLADQLGGALGQPALLHLAAEHAHGWIEWSSAGILAILFARALVVRGAAGFVEPLLHPHHDHPADAPAACGHAHSHGACDHQHAAPAASFVFLRPASSAMPVLNLPKRPSPKQAPDDSG